MNTIDRKNSLSTSWNPPPIPTHLSGMFKGYKRKDGRAGTANYWLFLPTVFCENRNLDIIKEAMLNELGYASPALYSKFAKQLLHTCLNSEPLEKVELNPLDDEHPDRIFPNVDGIKFLKHSGGCGGTRQDASLLSSLLAAYADHPNVGGITLLSLGCQHLEIGNFLDDLKKRNPSFDKPLYVFEQQQSRSEEEMITDAIRQTFTGLIEINKQERELIPVNHLTIGISSDNDVPQAASLYPVLGYTTDLLVAAGCKLLLTSSRKLSFMKNGESAALKGILHKRPQQAISNAGVAEVETTTVRQQAWNSGKSQRGGRSPVVGLLHNYSPAVLPGVNLVDPLTNTAENLTGIVASGATLVVFLTTNPQTAGNPVAPVITVTNTPNPIEEADLDVSQVISGTKTVSEMAEEIFQYCIEVASGRVLPHAVKLMRDDFMPLKTGVSL